MVFPKFLEWRTFAAVLKFWLEANEWRMSPLNNFWPMFTFYTRWKQKKTFDFLKFSRELKWKYWPQMG